MSKRSHRAVLLALFLIPALTACQGKLIDKVIVEPDEGLGTLKIALDFGKQVRADFSTEMAVGGYGILFINPATAQKPFEVGFNIRTDVLDHVQDIVDLSPVDTLPNGTKLSEFVRINYSLLQIKDEHPINSAFDLVGYLDVNQKKWFGVAVPLKFLDAKVFPLNVSFTQVFKYDSEKNPALLAMAIGPKAGQDGQIIPGQIAVFANISALRTTHQAQTLRALGNVQVSGPGAEKYENNPEELQKIENALIDGLNRL